MSVEPKSDVVTRAEIASLDRIRNVSMGLQNPLQISTGDLVPARDEHCVNFILNRNAFIIAAHHPSLSPHPSRSEHRICPKRFHWFVSLRHITKCRARRNKGDAQMFVASFKNPRCSKCGETMSLRIIEPERPGFDLKTFECPKCYDTKTLVAPITSAVDVSIASPTSTAILPPRSTRPFRASRDLCSRYR
jgi:hypothetical protein